MSGIKRIFVVEDEPTIGFYLEDLLEMLGWESVGIATRLDQALRLLETVSPDAAILDVNLHGERSYPVADALAARQIPYVFATGYGDTEHPDQHRGTPTITKPYTLADVERALASCAV